MTFHSAKQVSFCCNFYPKDTKICANWMFPVEFTINLLETALYSLEIDNFVFIINQKRNSVIESKVFFFFWPILSSKIIIKHILHFIYRQDTSQTHCKNLEIHKKCLSCCKFAFEKLILSNISLIIFNLDKENGLNSHIFKTVLPIFRFIFAVNILKFQYNSY